MAIELSKEQAAQAIPSLQRYFREELDQELSEMRARFLLDFIMKEIGPIAYNKGVADAEAYLRARLEDLPAVCFEEGMTHWQRRRR